MNKTALRKILDECGIVPNKFRGQNFLIDLNLIDSWMQSMHLKAGEQVLEVGPGMGVLTRYMLSSGCRVTSVEVDPKLKEYLESAIDDENFNLVFEDACRVNYSQVLNTDEDFRCIANLPFSISSIFIARMLELPKPPVEMFFLLQKEMAERLVSRHGTKDYGALSVRVQALYNVSIDRIVAPECFFPPPRIDSAIIDMRRKEIDFDLATYKILIRLTKAAFSQRRKQMLKAVKSVFSVDLVRAALESEGIRTDTRAEAVTVEQYIALAKYIRTAE